MLVIVDDEVAFDAPTRLGREALQLNGRELQVLPTCEAARGPRRAVNEADQTVDGDEGATKGRGRRPPSPKASETAFETGWAEPRERASAAAMPSITSKEDAASSQAAGTPVAMSESDSSQDCRCGTMAMQVSSPVVRVPVLSRATTRQDASESITEAPLSSTPLERKGKGGGKGE